MLLVLVIVVGMLIAALSSGVIEEAGPFGFIWAGSCVAIIIFIITLARDKNEVIATISETDELTTSESSHEIELRLKKLDELLKKNIISKEEYNSQRKKIVESI